MRKAALFIAMGFVLLLAGCLAPSVPEDPIKNISFIKVACVGDSLTYNAEYKGENYPDYLDAILSSVSDKREFEVRNFGVSGAAVTEWVLGQHLPARQYSASAKYQASVDYEPEIVFLTAGTNDTTAWGKSKETFRDEYSLMVEAYKNANPLVRIFVVLPPLADNWAYDPNLIKDELHPVLKSIAKEYGLETIDLSEAFGEIGENKHLYRPDALHPSAKGASFMADIFAEKVLDIFGIDHKSPVKPQAERVKVACIGDSFTYDGSHTGENYPDYLAEILSDYGWDTIFEVQNFGVASASVTGGWKGAKKYNDQANYSRSMDFAPDVLMVILGGRDTSSWVTAQASFRGEYVSLINDYKAVNPDLKVYIGTTPLTDSTGYTPETISDKLQPLQRSIADRIGATLVDVAEVFGDIDSHLYFYRGDRQHANVLGAKMVAGMFAEALLSDYGYEYTAPSDPGKMKLKVACVGDSLTYNGMFKGNNYPDYMLEKVADVSDSYFFEISNFGVSGTGVTGYILGSYMEERKYVDTMNYRNSISYVPDVVIFTLGTNDLTFWSAAKKGFQRQYTAIIESYLKINPDVQFFIGISPPTAHPDYDCESMAEVNAIQRAVAESYGFPTVDLNTAFSPIMEHTDYYRDDLLHPSESGADEMARLFTESLLSWYGVK